MMDEPRREWNSSPDRWDRLRFALELFAVILSAIVTFAIVGFALYGIVTGIAPGAPFHAAAQPYGQSSPTPPHW